MPRRYEETLPSGLVMSTFDTHLPNLDPARVRRIYLEAHAFELLLAVLGVLAAINLLVDPRALSESPIGRTLYPFDVLWTIAYALSGMGIVYGLVSPSPRVETLALHIFSAGLVGNLVAVLAVRGSAGAASAATYLAVIFAFFIRIRAIRKAIEAQNAIARRMRE